MLLCQVMYQGAVSNFGIAPLICTYLDPSDFDWFGEELFTSYRINEPEYMPHGTFLNWTLKPEHRLSRCVTAGVREWLGETWRRKLEGSSLILWINLGESDFLVLNHIYPLQITQECHKIVDVSIIKTFHLSWILLGSHSIPVTGKRNLWCSRKRRWRPWTSIWSTEVGKSGAVWQALGGKAAKEAAEKSDGSLSRFSIS